MKKDLILCRDSSNAYFKVSRNDIMIKSGELVPIAKGFLTVKDFNGNTFRVSKNDPRYLSGELVFISAKDITAVDKHCNTIICKPNDPRVLSGELTPLKGKKNKYINPSNNDVKYLQTDHPLVKSKVYIKFLSSVVTVRDEDGNCTSVSKNDSRIWKELIPSAAKHVVDCPIHGKQLHTNYRRIRSAKFEDKYKTYCPKCQEFYLSCDFKYNDKDLFECVEFLSYSKFVYCGVNYWWAKDRRFHRPSFMKRIIISEGEDENLSEDEIMRKRGYFKIYGSGNFKYTLKT